MRLFNKLAKGLLALAQSHGKAQTHVVFMNMTDRQLADIGVSRALLMEGVKAYPWRENEPEVFPQTKNSADVLVFPQQVKEQASVQPRLAA